MFAVLAGGRFRQEAAVTLHLHDSESIKEQAARRLGLTWLLQESRGGLHTAGALQQGLSVYTSPEAAVPEETAAAGRRGGSAL